MKNNGTGKKISIIILSIVLLLLAAGIAGFCYVKKLAEPVVSGEYSVKERIEIPFGVSVNSVSHILKEKGLIKSDKLFYYCARYPQIKKILFKNNADFNFTLKSGIYYIQNNMNICEIQELLSSGQQEFIKVSIPEGYTITKIAEILEEKGICKKSDFVTVCKTLPICEKYNIPGENCEGYLFPDTYFLTANMPALDVASLMIDNFFEKIKTVPGLSDKNPEDLYYTVRLASIVEREYRIEEEAPLIASVFKNRLKYNIGLYSCATIVYIITEIEGKPHPDRIFISDTKIDNPYNTYLWAGLPPGAISNPGLVALNASTNTPKTDYYYFQVADVDAGRHVFSKSFEDHIDNHNLYTKKVSK